MTRRSLFGALVSAFVSVLCLGTALYAQDAPAPKAFSIGGDVRTPRSWTPTELRALPRTKVEVKGDDRNVIYEGVLVGELLKAAGAPVGPDLRGTAIASYVVATATDGYKVVFSLAELDPQFTENSVVLADTIDGKPLFDYQGPFRIVAPRDARPARSIRMVERLDVVRLAK